jgi:hypothetical protein
MQHEAVRSLLCLDPKFSTGCHTLREQCDNAVGAPALLQPMLLRLGSKFLLAAVLRTVCALTSRAHVANILTWCARRSAFNTCWSLLGTAVAVVSSGSWHGHLR